MDLVAFRRARVCLVAAMILITASVRARAGDTPAAAADQKAFDDPFAYCRTYRNVDTPGHRYTGPKLTEEMAAAFKTTLAANPIIDWRCMDGAVWACQIFNAPICGKVGDNPRQAPSMAKYCHDNPNAPFIPAAAAGHDPIEWACDGERPFIKKWVTPVDARGFTAEYWKKVTPAASRAAAIASAAKSPMVAVAARVRLKTGAYVNASVPCGEASNATLMRFDGTVFTAGRASPVVLTADPSKPTTYTATVTVSDGTQIRETYEITSRSAFKLTTQYGSGTYRHCEEASLPPIWREARGIPAAPASEVAAPAVEGNTFH